MKGAAGAMAAGIEGCAAKGRDALRVKLELTPIDLEKKVPRPKGTMPMGVLGKTGIAVSKFGFGSHMREDMVKYTKEREWMVREALDLGVNIFDIYNEESGAFQYEPMGKYLEPVKNRVIISLSMYPDKGLTVEQEFENDLKTFRRDYIDMVRLHSWKRPKNEKELNDQQNHRWEWWDTLFKLKEKGYIRAVGVAFHRREDMKLILRENVPIDFAILPYNFYHNWTWAGKEPDGVQSLIPELRRRGMGVITMKPFAGDHLVIPFTQLCERFDGSRTVNFAQACLRYIINSGLDIDLTLCGMFNPYHVYEDIAAYFSPKMSDQERKVLNDIRDSVRGVTSALLPPHYQFLENWA